MKIRNRFVLSSLFGFIYVAMISFVSVDAAGAKMGADRHIARGLTCQTCYGPDTEDPQIPKEVIWCRDKAALAEKTKNLPVANPHNTPHNGGCVNCHLQHEPADNYCAQCHQFEFNVK